MFKLKWSLFRTSLGYLAFLLHRIDFFVQFSDVFIQMSAELINVRISFRHSFVNRIPYVVNWWAETLEIKKNRIQFSSRTTFFCVEAEPFFLVFLHQKPFKLITNLNIFTKKKSKKGWFFFYKTTIYKTKARHILWKQRNLQEESGLCIFQSSHTFEQRCRTSHPGVRSCLESHPRTSKLRRIRPWKQE